MKRLFVAMFVSAAAVLLLGGSGRADGGKSAEAIVDKAIHGYGFKNGDVSNPIHDARYLGCVLLPFLALAVVMPWRRRERWLIASLVGVLLEGRYTADEYPVVVLNSVTNRWSDA